MVIIKGIASICFSTGPTKKNHSHDILIWIFCDEERRAGKEILVILGNDR